jgi:hypothetical protein
MTEHWRRVLDNRGIVGVVFVDLKKAFDSISHPLLLFKLQGMGISGDIWLWIKDAVPSVFKLEFKQQSIPKEARSGLEMPEVPPIKAINVQYHMNIYCQQYIITE